MAIPSGNSKNLSRFVCKFALFAMIINCASSYFYDLESNDIQDQAPWRMPHNNDHLEECEAHSICSVLQANAKGINITPMCKCPRPYKCSNVWDPLDGHSVTQGSDQYKFCEPVPDFPVCSLKAIAYSTTMVYSKISDEIITTSNKLYCKCPELHNYQNDDYSNTENERYGVDKYTFTCSPLPTCKASEPCKVVTSTAETFLVNPTCLCPGNQSCPTATNHGVESFPKGKGMVHNIHCQKKQA